VLAKVLSPAYFARKDTRTPVRFAMIGLLINVILNLVLMFPLQHVGLALATAIAAWVNAALLYRGLITRGHYRMDARLRRRLPRIGLATLLMIGAALGLAWLLDGPLHGDGALSFLALGAVVLAGLFVYGAAAFAFGAVTRADLRGWRRTS